MIEFFMFLILLNFSNLVENVVIILTNESVKFALLVLKISIFEVFFKMIILVFGVVDFDVL